VLAAKYLPQVTLPPALLAGKGTVYSDDAGHQDTADPSTFPSRSSIRRVSPDATRKRA
jgi:hypothetical protein